MDTRQTVAIIGAGPLGRLLALGAARAGFRVLLEDVMPSTLHHAQEYIREKLGPAALPAVEFVSTVEDAVRSADLVIDCVPDELESKLEILWLLDRMAPPQTIFATPTTQLSIADLAACTYRPEKCIALVAQPEALANLEPGSTIRLRTSPVTAAETVDLVSGFWRRLGFEVDATQELHLG
ncbi:MAG: 3-hydroxyacyl-CoA dehydrogenase NAD-binding domain-containing protein [Terracidiphilus sp.]